MILKEFKFSLFISFVRWSDCKIMFGGVKLSGFNGYCTSSSFLMHENFNWSSVFTGIGLYLNLELNLVAFWLLWILWEINYVVLKVTPTIFPKKGNFIEVLSSESIIDVIQYFPLHNVSCPLALVESFIPLPLNSRFLCKKIDSS